MELLHGYLEMVHLLGKRLGELHRTLASTSDRPEFVPEPIALQYQRAVYQSMRNVMFDVLNDLEIESHRLPADLKEKAAEVQKLQPAILKEFRGVADRRIRATRIRCHGDCHLHQVLFTGKDFVFIDFEGRPRQSVGERRIKRSPFVDVATMVRSFDYAAYAALFGLASGRGRTTGVVRDEDRPALFPWARAWRAWTHHAFLTGWLEVCEGSSFLPGDNEERNILFRAHLIDQILLEIARQLRSDPAWLPIPLMGLIEAFEPASSPVTP
jgi:maltose alpha-D-glucosyltransferase/alpha-amylase